MGIVWESYQIWINEKGGLKSKMYKVTVSKMKIYIIIIILILLIGCEINGGSTNNTIPVQIEEDLTETSITFLNALYEQDANTLLTITREEARSKIENKEFELFQNHKIEEFEIKSIEQKEDNIYEVTIEVYSLTPADEVSTVYFQHLILKRFENDGLITDFLQDA